MRGIFGRVETGVETALETITQEKVMTIEP